MADKWFPQDIDVYISWVESIILESSDELTNWETEFIRSIYDTRLCRGYNLSEKQAVQLEKIYTEKTR